MNISITFYTTVVAVWLFIGTLLTYFLAKSRYENPVPVTALGFILSFYPPISIVFLILMAIFKKELPREELSKNESLKEEPRKEVLS